MNRRQRQNLHTAALCVVLSPFAIAAGWGAGYALEVPPTPSPFYAEAAPAPSDAPVLPVARELTRQAAPATTTSTPPTASVPTPAQEESAVTEPSTDPVEEPVQEEPVQEDVVEEAPVDEAPQEDEEVVMPTPSTPLPPQPPAGA